MQLINSLSLPTKGSENIFLSDSLHRVLAQDIIAGENSPNFPTSAMDGYAIQACDQDLSKIKILCDNPAGTQIDQSVSTGFAIKTFTGSLMPQGADTLIPIENVTIQDNFIIVNQKVSKGFAIREVGENYKKGEVLIKKGTIIDFAHIGVMASLNIVQVKVYQKPIVSIASTGSEILDLGEPQTNNAQIRSSNHLTLQAIGTKYGANVIQHGVVNDDKESILQLLSQALQTSDIVVTTGGVSVGDYDFVKDIIKESLGCDVLFQGVAIKPGQHVIVASKGTKTIIGLPGFAYSSTVTFFLYVLPIIFQIKGSNEKLQFVEAKLKDDIIKKGNKTIFTASNLTFNGKEYEVDFDGKKNGTSAILTNLLGSCGLVMLDQNSTNLSKGDFVTVLKLGHL
ncbi:MAG: molybdopterin molybdotransferase MoeA [Campylobacterales bacterium]|nr:molybdopterin molybdotransferase MoeA [Campylobacterales bacterium]